MKEKCIKTRSGYDLITVWNGRPWNSGGGSIRRNRMEEMQFERQRVGNVDGINGGTRKLANREKSGRKACRNEYREWP